MQSQDYIIASRRVRISGASSRELVALLRSFDGFCVARDDSTTPLVEIVMGEKVEFDASCFRCLTRFELEDGLGECAFYYGEDGYALLIEGDGSRTMFVSDKQVRSVKCDLVVAQTMKQVSYVRFGLWFVFNMAFVLNGCSAVHSSVVACRGGAVMFLGESGTGKSTHTRLWLENIEGAALLNDDSPFMACEQNGVCVYGSPWSGKTPCYKNLSYPLKAVVRLSQAPHNKIYKLNKVQAIGALLPSLPPAFVFDKVLEDALLQILSNVIVQVDVYHLECLPNAEAAHLSYKTIYGDD